MNTRGTSIRAQQMANQRPDAPGAADERIRRRAAGEQAHAEMIVRFAPLTSDNAREAIAWQESRIRELCMPAPSGAHKAEGPGPASGEREEAPSADASRDSAEHVSGRNRARSRTRARPAGRSAPFLAMETP